jgi:hypothetical protein
VTVMAVDPLVLRRRRRRRFALRSFTWREAPGGLVVVVQVLTGLGVMMAAREWGGEVDSVNLHEMAHSYFGDALVVSEPRA